jgi:signal transduction histidine kinase
MGTAFNLVALVPLGIALSVAYASFQGALTDEVRSRLSVIVDAKAKRVEGYLGGLKREILVLSASPDLLQIVGNQQPGADLDVGRLLEGYSGSFDYTELVVISTDGRVLGAANGTLPLGYSVTLGEDHSAGLGPVVRHMIESPTPQLEAPRLSRFSGWDENPGLESFVVAPMLVEGTLVGVIAAQVHKARMFEILNDPTGLGQTGSIYIGRREEGVLTYMASQAFADGSLVPRAGPERAVVAASGAIPTYDWQLMVSVDRAEAFASVSTLRNVSYVIFGITTLIVTIVSLLMARAVSVPLRNLSQATKIIAEGNLDKRVESVGHDEIALLGRDFNHMIDLIADYREQIESSLGDQTRLGADLQAANAQLRVTLERAEASNRSKSEFLANMSHEIRTPLNGVLGLADLLIDDGPADKDLKKLLLIKQCGQSLLELLNDILDISKLEAGRVELSSEATNVREVVEFVVESFPFRAAEKAIGLTLDIARDVPNEAWLDPLRLRQILFNLIGNAVKFTNAGEVHIEVGFDHTPGADPFLTFRIIDTGIGISDEAQDLIFDRFSQDTRPGEQLYGGTGLGLAICKQLVALMEGDITMESRADHGSIFEVVIPLADGARASRTAGLAG